jgi:hypothetical protein
MLSPWQRIVPKLLSAEQLDSWSFCEHLDFNPISEVLAKLTGSEATDHAAEKAPFKANKLVNWAEGVERETEEEQHDAGVARKRNHSCK